MADPTRQLVLDLSPAPSAAREDFVAAPCNAAALALIDRWPDWPARALALIGPEGAGKSHLAAIWQARAGAVRVRTADLPDADPVGVLATGAAVVEDVAAGAAVEAALFHLLNLAREHGDWLLLTFREPPSAAGFRLPDLASRLRALPMVRLEAPDDALLEAVTVKLFADAGLDVDPAVVRLLVTRVERSVPALRAAVAAVDAFALATKRPVTRALAAQVLRETAGDG